LRETTGRMAGQDGLSPWRAKTSGSPTALTGVLTVSQAPRKRRTPRKAARPEEANMNDFLSMRAVSGRPVSAIDAVLLRQYDRYLSAQGAVTPRASNLQSAAEPAPAPASSGTGTQESNSNVGLVALEYMRSELKLRCASLLSREPPQGAEVADAARPAADERATHRSLSGEVAETAEEGKAPSEWREAWEDPLLASIRAYRESLRQRQLELQARAASEHRLREQPASGWYALKGSGFHEQVRRLNRLDARARCGKMSLLQTLASL